MDFWLTKYKMLIEVADEASKSPEWSDYAAFCLSRERGLRREAFRALERFITSLESTPFCERRRFVSWLMHITDGWEDGELAVPHQLRIRLVVPTLREWTGIEPQNSEPFRWLGGYEELKHALELNSNDQIARRRLLAMIVNGMEYETHELPYGYVGDGPEEGLAALDEAEELLERLPTADVTVIATKISEMRSRIQSFLRNRNHQR